MPRARQDLARQRPQGLGDGHVSHVRPSLRRLAFDFASWQTVFPKVLFFDDRVIVIVLKVGHRKDI
jgi:hypothetical protein